jgi:MFS family permease
MQTLALSWLVLDLSHDDGIAVGVVIALQFLPTLLFGVWGGVLADRFQKRLVLVASSVVQGLMAVVLAALVFTGVVTLWMVFVVAFLFGCGQAFDTPVRMSFPPELVPRELVPNAIGLNSMTFNLARILAPALAGAVIVAFGTGWCFLANGVSFIAVIVALFLIRPREMYAAPPVARAKGQIREGLSYIWHKPVLRANVLLMVVVGLLAFNSPVTLPMLARISFGGNADTYGVMIVFMGIGAVLGSLWVARRVEVSQYVVFVAALVFGGAILFAAASPTLAVLFVGMTAMGVGQMAFSGLSSSLLQLESDPQLRGRVMAAFTIAITGTTPIGAPLIGWINSATSPRIGLALGGIGTLVASAILIGNVGQRVRRRRSQAPTPVVDRGYTRRVIGTWSSSPRISSATAGTGSGSENSVPSVASVGRPVASTTHHDASSAMPFGSVK